MRPSIRAQTRTAHRKACFQRPQFLQLHTAALTKQQASPPTSRPPAQDDLPQTSPRRPRTIFSGIQPTGIPHLGNYLGAISPWVQLQDESIRNGNRDTLYFSVVDLHSLTSRASNAAERHTRRRETLAILLASGLSPDHCTLFYQSAIPAHSELHWILSCDAGMGWLSRMPTWKTKLVELAVEAAGPNAVPQDVDIAEILKPSQNPRSQERLKLGLFSYPVLQAADILLYGTTHVPVGEDQAVHIEFARVAAKTFNNTYGKAKDPQTGKPTTQTILMPPEAMMSPARRIMSLTDAGRKMSKSALLARSRIMITDSPEDIRKKLAAAITDSEDGVTYEPERRPGVANLLEITAHIEGRSPADVAQEVQGLQSSGSKLRVLKARAADAVVERLAPVRGEFERWIGERGGRALDDVAERGRVRAEAVASKTMHAVRAAVGL